LELLLAWGVLWVVVLLFTVRPLGVELTLLCVTVLWVGVRTTSFLVTVLLFPLRFTAVRSDLVVDWGAACRFTVEGVRLAVASLEVLLDPLLTALPLLVAWLPWANRLFLLAVERPTRSFSRTATLLSFR